LIERSVKERARKAGPQPIRNITPVGILASVTGSAYDAFAPDYHWIFSEEHLSGHRFLHRYRDVLAALPPRAEVLDCACGTGLEALALARKGFRVTASDASVGMVEQARQLFADSNVDVRVERCAWDALASMFGTRFDAVLCTGNSIAHCSGETTMLAALSAMRSVLRAGGVLVVESRDWEQMFAERPRLEVRDQVAVRDGMRGLPLYVWTIPANWGEPFRAEVVLLLDDGDKVTHRAIEIGFTPFRKAELARRLEQNGFGTLKIVDDRPGWYFVTAS
jgi:SAM-dependent methyltransferase